MKFSSIAPLCTRKPNLIGQKISSLEGAHYIHKEQILKYNSNANINRRVLKIFVIASECERSPNPLAQKWTFLLKVHRESSIYKQGANTKM